MDEREKIIKTLRASGYGYFVTHEKANADEALNDAADALIVCITFEAAEARLKELKEERKDDRERNNTKNI